MGHFYFARHGETVWNVENKICGATDSLLILFYFFDMTNAEFAAFGIRNCEIRRYDF